MVAWPMHSEQLSPPPTVLIADDNTGWHNVVGDILMREGFQTFEAASVRRPSRSQGPSGWTLSSSTFICPGSTASRR